MHRTIVRLRSVAEAGWLGTEAGSRGCLKGQKLGTLTNAMFSEYRWVVRAELGRPLCGERARAGGWFARAQRLVEEIPEPRSIEGSLLIPAGLGALYGGDAATGAGLFGRAPSTASSSVIRT